MIAERRAVARYVERPGAMSAEIVEDARRAALGALGAAGAGRRRVRGRRARAGERRAGRYDPKDGVTHVGLALMNEGERFGGIDLELVAGELSDVEEQFLRSVQTFAGSAYVSALRRARPRNETLYDSLTGLLNFRSINEGARRRGARVEVVGPSGFGVAARHRSSRRRQPRSRLRDRRRRGELRRAHVADGRRRRAVRSAASAADSTSRSSRAWITTRRRSKRA